MALSDRCEWAGCRSQTRAVVDGYSMCGTHRRLHFELLRDMPVKSCAGCDTEFETEDPRRTKCDGCRRVRIDKRPTFAKRQKAA